ncbi:hypothetical protein BMF94_1746 [Rhodotorula taiwanensis]|uniref:Peptidase S8/S53 domain-containing protein n=1 Tax=Rhodotorula taiwanensis TaxID=741276 RepID=A0A2S5BEB6_9BASI|nr:hypothetical protein BMF94_1746 [Rhodotorula taiwanensis]
MVRSWLATAAAVAFAWTPVASAFKQGDSNGGDVIPGSFILQVDTTPSTLSKRGMSPFSALEHTLAAVADQGVPYTIRQRFDAVPEAFTGFSLQVGDDVGLDKLASIPGVQRVWPVRRLRLPKDVTTEDYQPVGDATSPAPMLRRGFLRGTRHAHTKRGTDFPPASAYAGDTFYPHIDTGIADLHNRGILGEGVKVGVIDSGVDYSNPILGGCFGPGCHISFGYDFAGDSFNGNNQPNPGPDPYASCTDHGTHVTGIVGALANPYGLSGAAPAATLGHYRVFGCTGDTADDLVLAALQRAHAVDNCDIINLSLGSAVGWLDNTAIQIYQDYLATVGVQVVASAGNDRVEGPFFSESPAAGLTTNAVGATDPVYLPAYYATVLGHPDVPYQAPMPLNVTGQRVLYFTSTNPNVTNDACSPLPASTPDLSDKVVVVKRGTCDFTVKLANVAKAGGRVVLVYNSQGSIVIPQLNVGTSGLQAVGSLRYEDGILLLSYYLQSVRGQVITFAPPAVKPLAPYITDNVSGGMMATYSSYGPTNDLYLFPSISAPGSSILSTVPGGLGIIRGTSMASPLVAGAYALLMSARKSDAMTPVQARALMMSTSVQVPSTFRGSTLDTVTLQGAGQINVQRAVDMRTLVSPPQLLLNDTAFFVPSHTVTLQNLESSSVTYTFSYQNARTIATYNNRYSQVLVSPVPNTISIGGPQVSFSQSKITLPAGGKAEVVVTFTAPRLAYPTIGLLPLYSGFVQINSTVAGSSSSNAYTIPYMGLAGKLSDMPVLDSTSTALGAAVPFIAAGQDIQSGPITYSLSGSQGPPICYFRLAGGTRRLSLDLVDAQYNWDATIPAVQNPAQRLAKRTISARASSGTQPFPERYADVPIIGVIDSPYYWPPRDYLFDGPNPYSDFEIVLNGTYKNSAGTVQQAPLGKTYKVLLRGQRITADPTLSASYDSWLSPPFTLNP